MTERSILVSVQGKLKNLAPLNPGRRTPGSAGRRCPVCLVSHQLRVLEPEPGGYDPYNKPPPPAASEMEAEAATYRHARSTIQMTC